MWEKAHGIVDKTPGKPGAKPAVAAAKKPPPPPAAKKGPAKPGDKPEEEKVDLTKELDEKVADALFNAALWHEGMGEDDKAIAEYQKYVDYVEQKKPGFEKKTDAPEVFFNIGLIHEKAGRKKEAISTFEAYQTKFAKQITPGKAYYAKYKQFVLLRDLHPPTSTGNKHVEDRDVAKLMDELNKGYAKLDQAGKDDDGNLNAFGHIRFLMLEPKWKEFVAINFKDPRHLVQELKEKVKRMAEIEKDYTDVLATRSGEWGIAALTRIGLGYEDFARDLIDSPDPKGLNPDQLEMYRGEIENKAFPLEDKAVEALEKALDKSSELKLYSEWTLKAQDQLNKVRPGAFGEARQMAFRGSEVFATAPAATAMLDVPKPPPEPTPAPGAAPGANGAAPAPAPKAGPKAGSGSN
jgi:tetratricopeptide (TPR) repeat protein